jgi:tight adherence protein B
VRAVLALAGGLGVFLCYDATIGAGRARRPVRASVLARLVPGVPARALIGVSAGAGLAASVVALLLVGSLAVTALAGAAGAAAWPIALRNRARRDARRRRACWPEAVDLLAGALRAGETLPGAIGVVADRGPEPLRPAFRRVVADHRLHGDLDAALVRLAEELADPVADQVSATLRIAHRVGGRETVRVLRTLGAFIREDLAVRAEIEARQSWTRVAARVAATAPWLVLLLVATRPEAAAAYDSGPGAAVLLLGAVATVAGYRLMVAVGRLPEPHRLRPPVLRPPVEEGG